MRDAVMGIGLGVAAGTALRPAEPPLAVELARFVATALAVLLVGALCVVLG